MIKITLLTIALAASIIITCFIPVEWYFSILICIGLFVGIIIVFALLFFGSATILDIPTKKGEIAKHYNKTYRRLLNFYVRIAMSIFGVYVKISGTSKLPKNSNFLLVQNHLSSTDPLISGLVFNKYPMIFVGKESLFKVPWFGRFVSHIGYIKLKRRVCPEDGREFVRGILWLERNECSIGIYPEGTRNKDYPNPLLLDYKPGSFQYATRANRPIVVTTIKGTENINDLLVFKIHKIEINIVDVIYPDEYANFSSEELCDKVRIMMEKSLKEKVEKFDRKILY